MNWEVVYTDRASADLEEIFRYIAIDLQEPEIAKRQVIRILDSIEDLVVMPNKNPLYDKEPWHSRGLRKLNVDKFLAFYLTNSNLGEIVIIAIMYGGRDITKLL